MLKKLPLKEANSDQIFDITDYFDGTTRAWGVFEDRFGRLKKTFDVEITGYWKESVFIMDERFTYSDGVTDIRKWHLETEDGGRSIVARCDDCIGEARGVGEPGKISLDYRLNLKFGDRSAIVRFSDRLYRMNDSIVLNRATMSKWGVRLGEVTLCFERVQVDG